MKHLSLKQNDIAETLLANVKDFANKSEAIILIKKIFGSTAAEADIIKAYRPFKNDKNFNSL